MTRVVSPGGKGGGGGISNVFLGVYLHGCGHGYQAFSSPSVFSVYRRYYAQPVWPTCTVYTRPSGTSQRTQLSLHTRAVAAKT